MPQKIRRFFGNPESGRGLRLEKLRKSLSWRGFQAFLVSSLTNIRYLTGFEGSSGWVFLTPEKSFFITDFRYKEEVERLLSEDINGWEIIIYSDGVLNAISNLYRQLKIRHLAIESSVTYEFYISLSRCGLKIKPLSKVIESLRSIKDDEEVGLIAEAVRRAEVAFNRVLPYIGPGRRETEIALRLEYELKSTGCRRLPFDIIVSSGQHSSMPHAKTTERRLSPGDLVIIDWGGEAGGYFSDMTRTLLLSGGEISRKIEIYEAVLRANEEAIKALIPGIGAGKIDKIARDVIKKKGFGEYFGHSTGHGVGLEVHESPSISPRSKDKLKRGSVFTIEPGIYIPGIGGARIEDMVYIGEDGISLLTGLPKELKII
jgi:Xaa-Pro aminopeptidase